MKFYLLLILSLLCGCKNIPNNDVIRFGVDSTVRPYSYIENGELKGFSIDLNNAIAKELNKKAEFHNFKWGDLIAALNNNKIDAVSSLTITEERSKNVDFSNPYHFDYITIISKKNTKIEDKLELEAKLELQNKKVGAVLGTIPDIFLKKNFSNIKIISMNSYPELMELLKANHVDEIVTDQYSARIFVKNNPNFTYKIIEKYEDGDAIGVRKKSKLLIEINEALNRLREKSALIELEEKWFGW